MKFDIKRFESGEMPTRTRCGLKVLKVLDSGLDIEYPLAAWIEHEDGRMSVDGFTREGSVDTYLGESPLDLVHETKTIRVLLWQCGPCIISSTEDELVDDLDASMEALKKEGTFIALLEHEVL